MASSNISWGIEIGAGGVRAVKLAADGDTVRVLEFMSFDHPKVLSTPDLDQNEGGCQGSGSIAESISLPSEQMPVRDGNH